MSPPMVRLWHRVGPAYPWVPGELYTSAGDAERLVARCHQVGEYLAAPPGDRPANETAPTFVVAAAKTKPRARTPRHYPRVFRTHLPE